MPRQSLFLSSVAHHSDGSVQWEQYRHWGLEDFVFDSWFNFSLATSEAQFLYLLKEGNSSHSSAMLFENSVR